MLSRFLQRSTFLLLVVSARVVFAADSPVCVPPAFGPVADLYGAAHGGFDRVHQMARRSDGRVYVADAYHHLIRVYTSDGTYLESFGGAGSALGKLNVPAGVAFDAQGNLFVAEQFNHRIQMFSPTHVALSTFGTFGSGPGQLSYPTNLALSPDGSRLYVVELLNHRVSMFDPSGNFLGSFGGLGRGPGQLEIPFGIVVDSAGDVFVAAGSNDYVARYDANGVFIAAIGDSGSMPGQFNNPVGLGLDEDENLYVTDQLNNRVHKLTKDGMPLQVFGSFGSGSGKMYNPWAVLPLPNGSVWVGDTFNYRVSLYASSTPSPRILSIADIPDDNGHQVRIRFLASSRDVAASPTPILQYEAFRRIEVPDPGSLSERARPGVAAATESRGPSTTPDLAGWDFVGAVPAHAESEYNLVAPTLTDSEPHQIHYATFFIRAATSQPAVYFDACADSGYSRDSQGPPTPTGFHVVVTTGNGDVWLEWDPSGANDFDHFELHRGDVSYFTPSPSNKIADLLDTEYTDLGIAIGSPRYYKLSATDRSDNGSEFAETVAGMPLDIRSAAPPGAFALYPIEPNPSSGVMAARFDVPMDAIVTIRVFDVHGRLIRALGERMPVPAGRHRWEWDGRNAGGARPPAGLYFVRLEASGFVRTRAVVRTD